MSQGYGRGSMPPLSSNQPQLMQQQGLMPQQQQQPLWPSQRAPPISSVANQQRLAANMNMPPGVGNRGQMGPVMMSSGQPAFQAQQQHGSGEMQSAESHMHLQSQQQHPQQQQMMHNAAMMRPGQPPQRMMSGNMPPSHAMQQQQQYQHHQQQMMELQQQQQAGPPPVYSSQQQPPTDLPQTQMHANSAQMQQQQQQLQQQQRGRIETVEHARQLCFTKLDGTMKKLRMENIAGKSAAEYESEVFRKHIPPNVNLNDFESVRPFIQAYMNEMRNLFERALPMSQQQQQHAIRASSQQAAMQQQQQFHNEQQIQQQQVGRFASGMPPTGVVIQGGGPQAQQQAGANPIDALQKMTGAESSSTGGLPRGPMMVSYEMQQQQQQQQPVPMEIQTPGGVRVLMSPPQQQQQLPPRYIQQQQQFQPQHQSQLHALVAGQQPPPPSMQRAAMQQPGGPVAYAGGPLPPPNVQLQQQQQQRMQQQQQQAGSMRAAGYNLLSQQQHQRPPMQIQSGGPVNQQPAVGLAPQFRTGPPMMGGSPAASVMSPAPTPPQRPSAGGPLSQPPPDEPDVNYRQKLKELADRYLGMVQSQSMSKPSSSSGGAATTGAESQAKLHQLHLILSGEKKVEYNVLLKCERVLASSYERLQQQQASQQQQPPPPQTKQSPGPPSNFDAVVKTENSSSIPVESPITTPSRVIKQEPMSTAAAAAAAPATPSTVVSTPSTSNSAPAILPTSSASSSSSSQAPPPAPPAAMYVHLRQPRIEVKRGEIGAKIMETLVNATNSIMEKRRQAGLMRRPNALAAAAEEFGSNSWMQTSEDESDADFATGAKERSAVLFAGKSDEAPQRQRRKPVARIVTGDFFDKNGNTDNDDDEMDDDIDFDDLCSDAELADLSDDVLSKLGLCLTYDEFEIKAPRIPLNFS